MTHDSNYPILGAIVSAGSALLSVANFVPIIQFIAGIVAIVSGIVTIIKATEKKK